MRNYFRNSAFIFGIYGVVFIPFPFNIISVNGTVADWFFGGIISFVSGISGIEGSSVISSDSSAMYVLVLLLFLLAFMSAGIVSAIRRRTDLQPASRLIISKVLCYYLALQLLKYGFAKIFKVQFYLPEPNILYTPFGQLEKDILFWSTMGTSHSYNLFLGITEVFASLLLLFSRTRVTGLLVATGILVNIVVVNFSFDISVKIFSLFLLFICLLLLSPNFKSLFYFLFTKRQTELVNANLKVSICGFSFLIIPLKILVVTIILTEAFYPFLNQWNLNDDKAERPFLHGAYEVIESSVSDVTSVPLVQRFFIHRDGYLIFQYNNGMMRDFKLVYDSIANKFILTDYDLKQTVIDYKLDNSGNPELHFPSGNTIGNKRSLILKSRSLSWKQLPALQDGFHWTIEGL